MVANGQASPNNSMAAELNIWSRTNTVLSSQFRRNYILAHQSKSWREITFKNCQDPTLKALKISQILTVYNVHLMT